MNELLLYSSLPMVLVMSGSHVLVNFIVVTWYLLLKEDLMEHNVGCVLYSPILVLLDSELQPVRTTHSGDCYIQLAMGEHLESQPDSHLLQCLT